MGDHFDDHLLGLPVDPVNCPPVALASAKARMLGQLLGFRVRPERVGRDLFEDRQKCTRVLCRDFAEGLGRLDRDDQLHSAIFVDSE